MSKYECDRFTSIPPSRHWPHRYLRGIKDKIQSNMYDTPAVIQSKRTGNVTVFGIARVPSAAALRSPVNRRDPVQVRRDLRVHQAALHPPEEDQVRQRHRPHADQGSLRGNQGPLVKTRRYPVQGLHKQPPQPREAKTVKYENYEGGSGRFSRPSQSGSAGYGEESHRGSA